MRKPRLLNTLLGGSLSALLILCASLVAHADELLVSIPSNVTGVPGNIITVYGSLTNTTSSTQYFGGDAINLTAPSSVASSSDDLIVNGLFGIGPTSIAPGSTLTNVDLFSVQFSGDLGTYSGSTFQLIGGADVNGCAIGSADCMTLLGTGTFAVTAASRGVTSSVPEPPSNLLLLSGLAGLLGLVPRRRKIATAVPQ